MTAPASDGLAAAVEALDAEGAGGFDPGGLHTARRLVEAVERVPEPARARLRERAAAHVARLRERLDARLDALRAAIAARGEGASERGEGASERGEGANEGVRALTDALARGAVLEATWALARRRARAVEVRYERSDRQRERLAAALAERAPSIAPPVAGPNTGATGAMDDPLELAKRLYRESVVDALTELEVRRVSVPPPETTGVYHGGAVAARAIEAMDALHRPYLKAQLARLETLGALEAFVAHVGAGVKLK